MPSGWRDEGPESARSSCTPTRSLPDPATERWNPVALSSIKSFMRPREPSALHYSGKRGLKEGEVLFRLKADSRQGKA